MPDAASHPAYPDRAGGQILADALAIHGVDTLFGVPGESYLAVLDGLYRHQDRMRFVICRHEGGASFMADAYAKLTGKPGVLMVTRGPGATNGSIGVHTAFQDSTPRDSSRRARRRGCPRHGWPARRRGSGRRRGPGGRGGMRRRAWRDLVG